MAKFTARVDIDGHLHSELVSVEAENAQQAHEIYVKKFVEDHSNSDGDMWADFVYLSDWEKEQGDKK